MEPPQGMALRHGPDASQRTEVPMKVTYRGVPQELPPKLQEKLDVKFGKLSKLLEKRGEKEAHVAVTTERHLHNAEITLQFYDHQLVGEGADTDLYAAMSLGPRQARKTGRKATREMAREGAASQRDWTRAGRGRVRRQRREVRGRQGREAGGGGDKGRHATRSPAPPGSPPAQRVFRVNHMNRA